jgi:hypothetical protein
LLHLDLHGNVSAYPHNGARAVLIRQLLDPTLPFL